MSWGEPKALSPFPEGSPFFGLAIPEDVTVESQVMAQPDPAAVRARDRLADRRHAAGHAQAPLGQGQVVLFHVTANAEWSSLPLSGLFVQMLERLAVSTRPATPEADDVAGTPGCPSRCWTGSARCATRAFAPGVPGEIWSRRRCRPRLLRPGLYAGGDRSLARNVAGAETDAGPHRLARADPGGRA
jgi:hypothetical protein